MTEMRMRRRSTGRPHNEKARWQEGGGERHVWPAWVEHPTSSPRRRRPASDGNPSGPRVSLAETMATPRNGHSTCPSWYANSTSAAVLAARSTTVQGVVTLASLTLARQGPGVDAGSWSADRDQPRSRSSTPTTTSSSPRSVACSLRRHHRARERWPLSWALARSPRPAPRTWPAQSLLEGLRPAGAVRRSAERRRSRTPHRGQDAELFRGRCGVWRSNGRADAHRGVRPSWCSPTRH